MSTGDIKNNLRKLKYELKQVGYIAEMDIENMNLGIPTSFLPILHYIVSDYSCELSSFFSYKGYDFCGKTDLRFIEVLYKLLIQEFNMKPMLTKQQFFAIGYAEMKIIFVTKIINQFVKKNDEILMKLGYRKKHFTVKKIKKYKEHNNDRGNHERETKNRDITEDLSRFEEQENPTVPSIHQSPTLPKPMPELCLTPLKSPAKPTSNTKSNESNESPMSPADHENVGHFVESGENDVLDVSFYDGMESSDKEIMEKHIQKPHFQITKHVLPVLPRIIENDVDFNIGTSDGNGIGLRNTQESITSVCKDCHKNTGKLYQMERRIKQLEDNFAKVMTINTDLSAKVILLETKVAMLENEKDHQSLEKNIYEGTVLEKENPRESIARLSPKTKTRIPLQQVDNYVSSTSTSNKSGMQSIQYSQDKTDMENQSKIYSSLEYTDDDVIIESFKPISMRDVHKMMLHDSVSSDILHDSTRFEKQYSRRNNHEKENYKNQQEVENFGLSNFSNISMFSDYIDEEAKNAVASVKQKLLETKLLLDKT